MFTFVIAFKKLEGKETERLNGRIADIYTVNIYNRHEALSATLDRTKNYRS